MIKDSILKIINGKNLGYNEVQAVINQIAEGKATDAQIASFLTALRIKGETVEEITAAAETMKGKCIPVNIKSPEAIDIVGTGGDCTGTFNISTAAAFIAAGAGCKVAKHGNRSVSSKSGAADVLEELGANINLNADESLSIFEKTGICFLFAPNYHPCMKYVAGVRREIGFRTLFNILGPLINPAHAKMQLIGVYDKKLVKPIAEVLKNLGITGGMTVHGTDGLDEATIAGGTMISEIKNSEIVSYTINPEDFGLKRARLEDIQGGDAKENAEIIKNIFTGRETGAKRDTATLNAALMLYITKNAASINEGVKLAKSSIDNGFALKTLEDFISLSNDPKILQRGLI